MGGLSCSAAKPSKLALGMTLRRQAYKQLRATTVPAHIPLYAQAATKALLGSTRKRSAATECCHPAGVAPISFAARGVRLRF